jgi:hypothetical protein
LLFHFIGTEFSALDGFEGTNDTIPEMPTKFQFAYWCPTDSTLYRSSDIDTKLFRFVKLLISDEYFHYYIHDAACLGNSVYTLRYDTIYKLANAHRGPESEARGRPAWEDEVKEKLKRSKKF